MEANLLLDVDRGADDEDAGLEVQRSNPLCAPVRVGQVAVSGPGDPFLEFRGRCIPQPRRSDEHTSELQSLMRISYVVCCSKKTTLTRTITRVRSLHNKANTIQHTTTH